MSSIWPQRRNPLEERVLRRRRTPADALPGLGECNLLINDNDQSKLLINDSSPPLRIDGGAFFAVPPAKSVASMSQLNFQVNPETISGGFRLDVFYSADGSRVWTCRSSSNRAEQHDVSPPFSIAPGSWTNRVSDLVNFSSPRCIWVRPDGLLFIRYLGVGVLNAFTMSPANDFTGMVAATGKFIGTGKLDMFWAPDGLTVWFYSSSSPSNSISEHDVAVAWDMSTMNLAATQVKSLTPDIAGIRSFTFSVDGTKFYMIAAVGSPGTLAEYTLSTPFDISTAGPFTLGPVIGDPSRMSIPRGLLIRPSTGDLYVFGDQLVGGQRVKVFG